MAEVEPSRLRKYGGKPIGSSDLARAVGPCGGGFSVANSFSGPCCGLPSAVSHRQRHRRGMQVGDLPAIWCAGEYQGASSQHIGDVVKVKRRYSDLTEQLKLEIFRLNLE